MSKRGALRFSSLAAMPDAMRRLAEPKLQQVAAPSPRESTGTAPRASKYGNHPTSVDGFRFDSKREANHYRQLKLRVAAGEVLFFLRQVPFHLPGNTRYVVDFLEFHSDGSVHVVDAKGKETQTFRLKKRQVEQLYPVRIELV